MRKRFYAVLPALLLLVGAAVAQIVGSLPFNLQNNTTADASQVMANFNAIVSGTNANGAKNGVNTDITQLSALSTPLTRAQGGTQTHIATATAGGSANAQTIAATSPTFGLNSGDIVQFVPVGTNTAATTLDVAGTGLIDVYRLTSSGLAPLVGGEIVSGSTARVLYNGTQYQLLTDATGALPPGAVLWTAGASADSGYLLLQGQAISRTTYAAVYAKIGDAYGAGDGVTTFNLPDVRGRTIFSVDNGVNRINDAVKRRAGKHMRIAEDFAGQLPSGSFAGVSGTFGTGAGGSPLVVPSISAATQRSCWRWATYGSANFANLDHDSINLGGSGTSFYPPAIVLTAMMKY